MELFTFPPFDVELTKGVSRHDVGDVAGSYDENAHKFGARLFRNGEPVDISGCTVSGYFIRPNGYTVTLKGTVEDGIAWVTLNKNCYYYDGAFTLAVKVSDVGIGTVLVVDGRIIQTRTDSLVDEENTIPSLEAIYSSIERVEQATAAANEAATKANAASENTPYIGANGHWYIWDSEKGEYVDSTKPSMPNIDATATTGAEGTEASVTVSGTTEKPVFNFVIPQGKTGKTDGVPYSDSNPSKLGEPSPGESAEVSRSDHVHAMPSADELEVVSYNAQNLTDAQKAKARENIGAGEPYSLPTATESVMGGVKLGGAFTAPGGVLTIDGEPVELVPFIEDATYSSGATIQTLVPFDANAIYLGDYGGSGAAVMTASPTGEQYIMRAGSIIIETISGTKTQINTLALRFSGDGVSNCELSYTNRYMLNGTGITQSTPTSVGLGPVWMLRKIAK